MYYEDPFWVAVFERISDGKLEACKVTFGAEPKDYEVYNYFLTHWHCLRFSPPVVANVKFECETRMNPKRMQRRINRQLALHGPETKARQALKEQQAVGKAARKTKTRQQKEAEQKQAFEQKQQKRKEKHRGR